MSRDALVVGINNYPRLNPLQKPAQDAEAIAQLLETYGDFRVRRLPEMIENDRRRIAPNPPTAQVVTVKKLGEALGQLFNPKGKNVPDTALFFFAGHGVREEMGGIEEGYLATSDADPEFNKFGISLQWLRRLLEQSPIRQQIIWLDCCYSGEILNFDEANPGEKGKARDRCFIAASREFEPAYEQLAGNHGVLTAALLDGLDPTTHQDLVNNHTLVNSIEQRLIGEIQRGEIQRPVFHNSGGAIILTATESTLVPKPKDTLKSISEMWPDFDLDNYAQRIKTRYRVLDLSALTPPARDDVEVAPILLKDIFVPQQVKENPPPRELPKEIWEKLHQQGEINAAEIPEALPAKDLEHLQDTWAQTEPESVLAVIAKPTNNRLILLGDPGSGKSTLARYLLLSVLEPPRDTKGESPEWVNTFSGHLPLLIELRHYMGEIADKNCLGFLEYFHYLGRTQGYTLNHQALKEQLKTRASLVIFDGLDEIFNPRERENITQEIIGFAFEYPKARIVVTSRIIGYQGKTLQAANFHEYTLQDLATKQIKTFARGWFNIVYQNKPEEVQLRYQRIDSALEKSPAIRQLAGNPLLLTMIAIIAKHQELPRERAKLYEHATKVLCHHWDITGHQIPVTETPADFMLEDDKLELLRRVAWRMQAAAKGLAGNFILKEDLQAEIETYLKERWQLPPVELTRLSIAMIAQLRERNFILCLYGAQVYGFVHRTFLEYFCAAEIVHRFEKQQTLSFDELKTEIFLAHYQDETWHEVLLLICGMVASHFTGQLAEMLASCAEIDRKENEINQLSNNPLKELLFAKACLDEATEPQKIEPVSLNIQKKLRQLTADQNGGVRRYAIDSLAKHYTQNPEVLPLIKQFAIYDKDKWVRRAAIESLAKHYTQNPKVLPLIKQFATDDKNELVRAIAVRFLAEHCTQNPEVLPLIKQVATDDKHEDVRSIAVQSLAEHYTQNPEVLPLIKQVATNDKKGQVRYAAVKYLVEHYTQNPEVLPLIKQIATNTNNKDELVRRAAVESLAEHYTQDPEVLSLLSKILIDDEDADVRKAAVGGVVKNYDEIWQNLLSRNFDKELSSFLWDWLDSKAFIDEKRIEAASKALGLLPETIRQHYEAIAKEMPLRLSWIQKEK